MFELENSEYLLTNHLNYLDYFILIILDQDGIIDNLNNYLSS